ncbi:MAG: hypothetical protein ACODAB_10270, partial [Gemmatimonadota bacterium]
MSHWLGLGYGQSIEVFEATPEGPSGRVEVPITEGPGDDRFSAVTTLDVDGDGLRDVVVRNTYGGAALIEEPITLTIIHGAAAPFDERERTRFVSEARVAGGGFVDALGDWDGDGNDDLVASFDYDVLLSGSEITEPSATCDRGAALGDIDGDGLTDSGCVGEDGTLLVVHGGGTDGRMRELRLRESVESVAHVGDVNGDGLGDVLVRYVGGEQDVLSGGDLDGPPLRASDGGRGWTALGDVDGDGFDDLAARYSDRIDLARGGADGLRGGERLVAAGDSPGSVRAAGDANCDGFADVLISGAGRVSLHLGGRAGVATTPSWTAESAPDGLV